MEERQVTVDGEPRPLPDPFLVVATQNPVEYEGTYPLPEAQLDRFLLKLTMPLPPREDETRILAAHHAGFDPRDLEAAGLAPVADRGDAGGRAPAGRAPSQVRAEVMGYIVDIARATRQSPSLSLGVSPRGATALLATSKAWAWLSGRDYVTPDDVKALARPTLRHRVQVRPEAELEGVTRRRRARQRARRRTRSPARHGDSPAGRRCSPRSPARCWLLAAAEPGARCCWSDAVARWRSSSVDVALAGVACRRCTSTRPGDARRRASASRRR